MGATEVEAFLTHLAVDAHVTASPQNQALSGLLFLSAEVLHQPLEATMTITRARRPERLPTVLSRHDLRWLLDALSGTHRLMAQVRDGSGLRYKETQADERSCAWWGFHQAYGCGR